MQKFIEQANDDYAFLNSRIETFESIEIQNIAPKLLDIDLRAQDNIDIIKSKYMLAIYRIIQENHFNEFTINQLLSKIKKSYRTVSSHISDKLFPLGLIEEKLIPLYLKTTSSNKIFCITKKGFEYLKKLIDDDLDLKTISNKKNQKINDLAQNLIAIYNFTKSKKLNEFTEKELLEVISFPKKTKSLEQKVRFLSNYTRRKLLKRNVIERAYNPKTSDLRWNIVLYKLSDNAIRTANSLLGIDLKTDK